LIANNDCHDPTDRMATVGPTAAIDTVMALIAIA
jgi:hypothetical protein